MIEALRPTPAGHPLCSAVGSGNQEVLAGARLAHTLAAAAWELSPSTVGTGKSTRIYEGADGEGTVWAVGVCQGGPSRRVVFELYASLESLACADQKELVALWASVCKIVGETLPQKELRVWANIDADDPDYEAFALGARRQADLARVAEGHGLVVEYWRERDTSRCMSRA